MATVHFVYTELVFCLLLSVCKTPALTASVLPHCIWPDSEDIIWITSTIDAHCQKIVFFLFFFSNFQGSIFLPHFDILPHWLWYPSRIIIRAFVRISTPWLSRAVLRSMTNWILNMLNTEAMLFKAVLGSITNWILNMLNTETMLSRAVLGSVTNWILNVLNTETMLFRAVLGSIIIESSIC